MVASATRTADAWEAELSSRGTPPQSTHVRDVHSDMMRLTLEIACRTLFGADACPDPGAVGRAMEEGLEAIENRFRGPFPLPAWVPTPSNLRLRRVMRSLHGVINDIIARRRVHCGAGFQPASTDAQAESLHHSNGDLLSTLLQARDDDGSGMTGAQLLDETLTIFLAGHETTALALTYSMYLLSLHPQAQEKLRAELSSVLGDRPPEYSDLPKLAYTRNVVTESMRLYPPADFLGREAVNDCTVGGIRVPKGTNLFMSQWVMHHDPRYFPDPDTFDPDRWTPEFERNLPRFAYFPFGGGPRYCIGQTFALAEAALVLATLCRRFSFAPDPTYRLELWPSITLRPRHGIRLVVAPI
jgi:cytochrome P450